MAIRQVRVVGDAVLTKRCKEVKAVTPRIRELVQDMFDTMYEAQGVGLAAPQVGVLRRIIVTDTGNDPRVLINPVIVEREGEQTGEEGCLSYPGKYAIVKRPMKVVVEGFDLDMQPVRVEAEGLLARDFCHETDHLDGKMYMELAEDGIHDVSERDDEDEAPDDEDTAAAADVPEKEATIPEEKETGAETTVETEEAKSVTEETAEA